MRLVICAALVAALLLVAFLARLPFAIEQPGITADTLGSHNGQRVITVTGHSTRPTVGNLRMTTIEVTGPDDLPNVSQVFHAWWDPARAVVPHEQVYPSGQSVEQVNQINQQAMTESQNSAVAAALGYLHLNPAQVKVTLRLADVGGPSAGLMFTLGIVDQLDGNGTGKAGAAGDLTNGQNVAGTGEIDDSGNVGAVGGVALKTRAAARDGATVFLVPRSECSDAKVDTPKGLLLVPVETLNQAVGALKALQNHDAANVPHC
ncbi:S16 family serine protease [Streptacidiphilus monticola]|uniref:S16 family serine protease n=1 Tax=Streptacidiphilus monticola TaxID=2161674 RepID=A0ABW1FVZ5_9ACTN